MTERRVLVVEDDEGLGRLIQKTLTQAGYHIKRAARGREAAEILALDSDQVLLLDQKLPDMSGRELLDNLAGRGLRVPFIVMTGQGDERLAVEMMKLGASDYLIKGMDLLDLLPGSLERLFRELATERKLDLTEKSLRESEAQLLQAQKLESVGRLAGGVAHDFNNMLGVILGHCELAESKLEADHPVAADLREIRRAGERSADLTRQLLAYARKQTITPKVLDINETVAGMLSMLRRLIGEQIELIWNPGGDLWKVRMDPGQLDQIMTNLCVNARDAISGQGQIRIETVQVREAEDFRAHYGGVTPGNYVLLKVSDSGCGMDAGTLEKLFEPFFTTKEVGLGTGLGLSTVYGILKQNGAFVLVDSEPGAGTTFRIFLPGWTGPRDKEGATDEDSAAATGSETVLLVEDEPSILEMTRIMLRSFGYRVLTASSPAEALRIAREHRGTIDLLISDVVMPEMNGRDLARSLLPLYPQMKRLFMSGYTADVIAHHGVLAEGVFFLQKPFTMKLLSSRIREALAK